LPEWGAYSSELPFRRHRAANYRVAGRHSPWRLVAPALAQRFTVIYAGLRGYGRSGCPPSDPGHAPYAKRAMADEMVAIMERLGFPCFSVAGHDRGGRVAFRLALDHPERVESLAVLDILPVAEVWEPADKTLATTYWPRSLLAQPERLPERLVRKTVRGASVRSGGWRDDRVPKARGDPGRGCRRI
jgi:pimeloyl-ACP methyl ester carboxylesterase